MSGRAIHWNKKFVRLGGNPLAKAILSHMADAADDDGNCSHKYSVQKRIADETEISLSTIKERIKLLKNIGIIQVFPKQIGKHKTVNRYRLRIEFAWQVKTFKDGGFEILSKEQIKGPRPGPSENSTYQTPDATGPVEASEIEGPQHGPTNSEGPHDGPLKGRDTALQKIEGPHGDPLKGRTAAPYPIESNKTNINNNKKTVGYDETEQVVMTGDWKPNEYIFENLKFQFGIPREFCEDQIPEFALRYLGETRKQNRWQSAFCSNTRKQWDRFRADFNEASPAVIPEDWQPSDLVFDQLESLGISREFIRSQVPGFVIYWSERGVARASFGSLFVSHCTRNANQVPDKAFGSNSISEKPKTGILESLSDRSWAETGG